VSHEYLSGFAGLLRRIADRIAPDAAPHWLGWSFTFEIGEGVRWHDDGRGCPVWYLGEADYLRAHDESETGAPRIDWANLGRQA